jgi:hypothetical protein
MVELEAVVASGAIFRMWLRRECALHSEGMFAFKTDGRRRHKENKELNRQN